MKLPILLYHKIAEIPAGARYPENYVTPRQFAAQLALLEHLGYQSISFSEYLTHRREAVGLPRRAIILTFDDGYRSNRDVALPLLQRHGFRATVFLVAAYVGRTNAWDVHELQEPLLTGEDIRAMCRAGTDFQSHTTSHRCLTALSPAEAFAELQSSRELLSTLVGRSVNVLAYPYGEHDRDTQRLACEAGYEAAVMVRRRLNSEMEDLFALKRIPITYRTSLGRFAWDLFRLRWR